MQDPLTACRAAAPGIDWQRVGPRALPPLRPPGVPLDTLRRALARAARPILLVNDLDRAHPVDLAAVVRDLWEGDGRRATVLVATGTHKADRGALVDALGGLEVELHDASDDAAHVELDARAGAGEARARIDRRVARADLILAFGTVEPHYFGGWAGAHKTASIGVLARSTIEQNHVGALDPRSRPAALDGNPVFDGIARVLRALEQDGRRVLAVDQVLDDQRRPVGLGVGTWRGALERCLPAARQAFLHTVAAPVDALVARVPGVLGRNLYQAEKGLKNSEDAVKDGGAIVIEAALEHGVGPDRFVKLLEGAPDVAAARAQVAAGYALGDHKAVKWRALEARGVRIVVASPRLDPARVAAARITVRPTLEAALAEAGVRTGRGLVVDDAGLLAVTVAP